MIKDSTYHVRKQRNQRPKLMYKNQSSHILGIDPGKFGALAAYDRELDTYSAWDFPLTVDKTPDYDALAELVEPFRDNAAAILEKVNGHHMGCLSAFNFGANFGAWRAVLAANDIDVQQVVPSVWKPAMGLSGSKEDSLKMARLEFPDLVPHLKRKKDHGRAEALLLIRWWERSVASHDTHPRSTP